MNHDPSPTVAAGIAGAIVALLGVEPQALVWAAVGAIFGAPLAPQAGRVRQILVFMAVVLACALLGHWAADSWHQGSVRARNAWALVLAAGFHPLSAAVVASIPSLWQAFASGVSGFMGRRNGDQGGQP